MHYSLISAIALCENTCSIMFVAIVSNAFRIATVISRHRPLRMFVFVACMFIMLEETKAQQDERYQYTQL